MPARLSSPPTRSRSFWPSMVCVSITARSAGVRGPGLLMISVGMRILPTWCRRADQLGVASLLRVEPELVRDRDGERRPAVQPGVCVVGLDDIPEQQGRPPVGGAELEHAVDAGAPLAGEHVDECHSQYRDPGVPARQPPTTRTRGPPVRATRPRPRHARRRAGPAGPEYGSWRRSQATTLHRRTRTARQSASP